MENRDVGAVEQDCRRDVRRIEVLQQLVAGPGTREGVRRVDGRRVDGESHLARPGVAVRQAAKRTIEPRLIGGNRRARACQRQHERRIGDILARCAPVHEARAFGIRCAHACRQRLHEGDRHRA